MAGGRMEPLQVRAIVFLCVVGVVRGAVMPANNTEALAVWSVEAAGPFPAGSAAMRKEVMDGFPVRAVRGMFAQEAGVHPHKPQTQLEEFGALVPWPRIVEKVTPLRAGGAGRTPLLLVMIRHGQAFENINPLGNEHCEFTLDNRTIPNLDSDLTPLGVEQAVQLQRLLLSPSSVHGYTWFQAMGLTEASFFVSPLSRTMHTAEHALGGLPVRGKVTATEMMRASIGFHVCNFRRSVRTSTASRPPPTPWSTGCNLPDDGGLEDLYRRSPLKFDFPIRPAGGAGIGLLSDDDILWRRDFTDSSHQARATAFIAQLFDHFHDAPPGQPRVAVVVTHGEMISAVYAAAGLKNPDPANTEVVPIVISPPATD